MGTLLEKLLLGFFVQSGREGPWSDCDSLGKPTYEADRERPYREEREIRQLEDVGGLRKSRKISVPCRRVTGSRVCNLLGPALHGGAGRGLRRLVRCRLRDDHQADARTLEHVLGVRRELADVNDEAGSLRKKREGNHGD